MMALLYAILIFFFISAFGFAYSTAKGVSQHSEQVHRMPEDSMYMPQARRSRNPFRRILRLIVPATSKVSSNLKTKGVRDRLITANSTLNVAEFFALRLLSMIFSPIAFYILIRPSITVLVMFLVIGYLLPDLWLRRCIRKRHNAIRRDLPNVIDLLNLCVGAGLDFMLAVNRVIKSFKPCPLIEELTKFWHENMVGKPRRDALRSLSARVNLPELSSFVRTLIQADRMGSPVSEALSIQSEEIRIRRFLRGEETALKAPIKLLFPLLFFILPVVLIIVGGPILLQFMRGGIKFF